MDKIIIPYETLYHLYIEKNLSKKEVAKKVGYSIDTVTRNLKEQNIPSHKPKDWLSKDYIELTNIQKEYLDGALLGDGCLSLHKNSINSKFIYSSKSKQHVEFVFNPFMNFMTSEEIKHLKYFDKRTQKTYEQYRARTFANPCFQKEKERWYKEGKKIIPPDLKLSPTTCLIWYLGDGSLIHSKHHRGIHIKLSTDCFTLEEVKFLCQLLTSFEAHPLKDTATTYRIYIPHHKIKEFLEYIGPCPFEDYKHKWNYIEYKNFSALKNPETIKDFVDLFNKGWSAGSIAKKHKVDRSTVVRHLLKLGLNPKDNLFKKGVVDE